METADRDPWIARDKLYHLLFCLLLTLLFTLLASRSRLPVLRRHSLPLGSLASLLAGAAKEAADHLRLFPSEGASAKDAVADLAGVLIAAAALSLFRPRRRGDGPGDRAHLESDSDYPRAVSMV